MEKQVTIKEIAERANISNPTVSRILNNKKGFSVKQETRNLVQQLAKEMGYQPNQTARSLRGAKKNCIGIVGESHLGRMDDLNSSRIYAGIGDVAEEFNNYITFIPQHAKSPDEAHARLLQVARSHMVDGLIIFVYPKFIDIFNRLTVPLLNSTGLPYVALHNTARDMVCHSVGFNRTGCVQLAVQHLVRNGYSDIGLIAPCSSPDGQPHTKEYISGYRQTMEDAGLSGSIRPVIEIDRDADEGRRLAAILNRKANLAEAYVIYSDQLADAFMHELRQQGLQIPGDVGLVGCDNISAVTSSNPFLTAVDCRYRQQGQEAARYLYRLLDKKPAPEDCKVKIFEPKLMVRHSSVKRAPVKR